MLQIFTELSLSFIAGYVLYCKCSIHLFYNDQNPLHMFSRNFPRRWGSCQLVTDLLATRPTSP